MYWDPIGNGTLLEDPDSKSSLVLGLGYDRYEFNANNAIART